MNRRDAVRRVGAAISAMALASPGRPSKVSEASIAKRNTIAMLLYPGFTALDLVGPHHIFSVLEGYKVELVWKTLEPVTSDLGMVVKPTAMLENCPEELAVLFVPGGTDGTLGVMEDRQVLDFLASREAKTDYVTSVCTGALALGAAGLLRGYKATTHWAAIDVLEALGAQPVHARVVHDRNRYTGAGVTAGIDFGLTMAAELKGEQYAQLVQLFMEYEPAPPFKSGTPAGAGAGMTKTATAMFAPFVQGAVSAAERARASW